MADGNQTIVIAGGHAVTTAVATVQELQKRGEFNIHWIGARSAIEGRKLEGTESIVFPQLNVKLHSITTGRLQKRFTRYTIPALFKIPIGIVQAFFLLGKVRPNIVVSFGGFAAFPVVLAAFLRGIPIILHEQTIAVGLANKASAIFATKIAIARESSRQYFNPRKVVLTGNPVMEQIRKIKPKSTKTHVPVIFITCGSRGSKIINDILIEVLPNLAEKYTIIHLTGKLDYARFVSLQKSLVDKSHYHVHDTVDPLTIDSFYQSADIVVARAGANTVSELMIVQRPSILIPIPWTRFNEQQKNAESLEQTGLARVLQQDEVKPQQLVEEIDDINRNWQTIVTKASPGFRELDMNAAVLLVDNILSLL